MKGEPEEESQRPADGRQDGVEVKQDRFTDHLDGLRRPCSRKYYNTYLPYISASLQRIVNIFDSDPLMQEISRDSIKVAQLRSFLLFMQATLLTYFQCDQIWQLFRLWPIF